MSPELITIWSYAALAVIVVIAGLFAFVCGPDAVRAWRELFTTAGDDPACACDRFHAEVFCLECRKVRVLTPTSTLSTADTKVLLDTLDESQRRRNAFAEFDEIDLDLDDAAVN